MDLTVSDSINPTPFLSARDTFMTEFDLEQPVTVRIVDDPVTRTRVWHESAGHTLVMSRATASSELARELTLHEFGHMHRFEEGHISHHFSTTEAIWLAACGRTVDRDRLTHCYQIANHVKDIYADDLTVDITARDKLVAYFESSLAQAVEQSTIHPDIGPYQLDETNDTAIAVVNAAFAIGLLERHDLIQSPHRLYTLADVLAKRADDTPFDQFRQQFRTLSDDPTESGYRRFLVDILAAYLRV